MVEPLVVVREFAEQWAVLLSLRERAEWRAQVARLQASPLEAPALQDAECCHYSRATGGALRLHLLGECLP